MTTPTQDDQPELRTCAARAAAVGWKHTTLVGNIVAFSDIVPADDQLHPVAADAPFTTVETNLYGFNIPEVDIQCNIYALWHPVLHTMSFSLLVYQGKRVLHHQLEADYWLEHQYLPAVDDLLDYELVMGTCRARLRLQQPLQRMHIEVDDPSEQFALRLQLDAAMPPVGRPGGQHFTQLMKTSGSLVLHGRTHQINGHHMRDRSWGYPRPEQPERTPPYRWMTGWVGDDCGFVLAWLDTSLIDAPAFGPHWNRLAGPQASAGENKWESGGPTPSLNLRSGWFAVGGQPRPVQRLDVRTRLSAQDPKLVEAIELDICDHTGEVHHVVATTQSMAPKMYWQNLLVYKHFMQLTINGRGGAGDLMDTYSTHHLRHFAAQR